MTPDSVSALPAIVSANFKQPAGELLIRALGAKAKIKVLSVADRPLPPEKLQIDMLEHSLNRTTTTNQHPKRPKQKHNYKMQNWGR